MLVQVLCQSTLKHAGNRGSGRLRRTPFFCVTGQALRQGVVGRRQPVRAQECSAAIRQGIYRVIPVAVIQVHPESRYNSAGHVNRPGAAAWSPGFLASRLLMQTLHLMYGNIVTDLSYDNIKKRHCRVLLL